MEKAIKKAIEGGYKRYKGEWHDSLGHESVVCIFEVVSDPLFWQALNKVEKWGYGYNKIAHETKKLKILNEYKPVWQYHWHRFIDHRAEGKDIDSFFNNLLTN